MRSRRLARRGEEGSALIIALAFTTAIGLLVAMVLSFNDAGIRAAKSYRERTRSSYAADGAMAAAIKRYSTTGPCNNFTAPLVAGAPDAPVNGRGVIVSCKGPPPAGSRASQPINSLLSLGLDTTDPTIHGITSSEDLRLLGDVFSNTTVNQTSGTMVVQGQVSALGDCDGAIQTAPPTPLHCADTVPASPADPTRGLDPDYTKATTVVPMRRTVPACPAGWLVSLEPGYYDDAAALNALTASPGCNDKVVWFQPGTYYFDLAFRGGPETTWRVNNDSVVVVAGTPRGWDPDPADPRPNLSVPGSCKTETDEPAVPGVQLIAGGGSRLHVERGRMELCATANPAEQQLALYGYRAPLPTHDLESADITATGAFTDALNAQVVDEQSQDCPPTTAAPCVLFATAKLTAAQPTGSLELERFRPGIPSGSVFRASDTATLMIKHKRSGPGAAIQATIDFPGNTCLAPQPLNPNPTVTPDTINLRSCGLTRPEDLAGLKVTYAATLNPGGPDADVEVDGLVVEIGYQTPTTRKPTKVVAASGFANPDRAFEIGEQPGPLTADAALSSSGPTSASITVLGIGDLPMSPLASIDQAVLRVAHHDVGDTAGPRVTVTFPSGTCDNLPVPHRPGGITDDRIDLKACGLDAPNRLRGLTATFTASLSPGGATATSRLDGIWLELLTSPGPPGPPGPQPSSIRQAKEPLAPTPFANASRALFIGEAAPSTADVTLSGSTISGALTVRDFNDRIPLPPGSRIDKAFLRVAHQEDTGIAGSINAVVPSVGGYPGGACTPALGPSGGVMTTHPVDLAPCNLQTAEQLAAMTATYTATRTDAPISATRLPTAVSDVSNFANSTRALTIDGVGTNAAAGGSTVAADARLTGQQMAATIRLSGFNQTPLPVGSTIETATLRIAHQEDPTISGVSASIAFTGNTSCTAAKPLAPIRTGLVGVEVPHIDVKACGLNNASQLADFSVLYSATRTGGNGTDYLDGIALDITYRPPVVARLDGIELDLVFEAPNFRPLCLAGPTSCDLLTVAPPSVNDVTTRFVANGTIFAPSAGVDVKMYGLDTQVLRRGVVARSIKLGLRPKAGYGRPTGSIPPENVFFTAYPDRTIAPQAVSTTRFSNPPSWASDRDDGITSIANVDADPVTPPPEVVLSDYDQTDLKDGDVIDGATIRVRHRLEGTTARLTVEAGGKTCVDQELAARPGALGEDQIDLGTCDGNLADNSNLTSVTVTYRLDPTATAPAVAELDGITLEVLSRPLVRASTTFDRAKATVKEWSVTR